MGRCMSWGENGRATDQRQHQHTGHLGPRSQSARKANQLLRCNSKTPFLTTTFSQSCPSTRKPCFSTLLSPVLSLFLTFPSWSHVLTAPLPQTHSPSHQVLSVSTLYNFGSLSLSCDHSASFLPHGTPLIFHLFSAWRVDC